MTELYYQFSGRPVAIRVADRALAQIGELLGHEAKARTGSAVFLVSDHCVASLYAEVVRQSLQERSFRVIEHRIAPGEASKSLSLLGELHAILASNRFPRDGWIVALGGGVVSDLAGFAAATWMRGVDWVVVPTTLEADIDACLGGKTAINVPGGKNLVGAFCQPRLIVIDPQCLTTLDARDVRAGLAESVKHAVIDSEEFLAWHEAHVDRILSLDGETIEELIVRNLRIKARFVADDVEDRTGRRAALNFGHTFGHAIEECCGYSLRHGECVALGMRAACRMSRALGLLDAATTDRIDSVLDQFGLPRSISQPITPERLLEAMLRDKKISGGSLHFVLLEGIGNPVIRSDVAEAVVREAMISLLA